MNVMADYQQGAGVAGTSRGVARASSAANLARLGRDQELRKLQVPCRPHFNSVTLACNATIFNSDLLCQHLSAILKSYDLACDRVNQLK